MGDQASTDDFTNQCRQVRRNDAHLRDQIGVQGLAVLRQANNSPSERSHVLHVSLGDFLTHAVLAGINNALRNTLIILHECRKIMQLLIGQVLLVLDEQGDLGIALIF